MTKKRNKNSFGYKVPKLKDLLKGFGFEEIPKNYKHLNLQKIRISNLI